MGFTVALSAFDLPDELFACGGRSSSGLSMQTCGGVIRVYKRERASVSVEMKKKGLETTRKAPDKELKPPDLPNEIPLPFRCK